MDLMLSVKDLDVYYGAIHAIKGISFEVNEGEIVTLIGANGAGKTTTLHAISGLVKPKNGEIAFCGAEQQMVAMARALMSNPKMLLLDEPSMGLSPLLVEEIFQIIQDVNKSGVTVLLVEQNAKMAMQIANRVYVMETGTIMMSGNSEEMRNNEQVRRAYLGG